MVENNKEKQQDLFGFNLEEKELKIKENKELKKIKEKAISKIAKRMHKEQEKKNKKKNRLIDEANFNESVKIIKKYLSWNDDSGNKYHHLRDYTNRIESSYSQETSKKLGVSIYKFKWNLPLFNDCCKLLSKKSFIFPGTVNLSDKILDYKNMIEDCEELLNPEKDLYDHFEFFDIKMKEGKKEPDWYLAIASTWNDRRHGNNKGYLLAFDKFKSQKIFFKRKKNVLTLSWHLPDNIESVNFLGEDCLSDRIKYAYMDKYR